MANVLRQSEYKSRQEVFDLVPAKAFWMISIKLVNTLPQQNTTKREPRELRLKRAKHWMVGDTKGKGSGGRLNKKDGLTRYGNSHVKDKTS